MFNIIVAMCKKSRGIGFKNELPFHIPQDLSRFKTITKGNGYNSVIMGSKTWFSLPIENRPLKGRENIVLSRRGKMLDLSNEAYLLNNIDLLSFFCKNRKYDENWIIGGNEIYTQALKMGLVKKVFITEIDKEYECDTFFPELNYNYFELNKKEEHFYDGIKVTYKIFGKKLKRV